MGTPAKCLPSATGMAATFDPELMHEVGLKLLAQEAKLEELLRHKIPLIQPNSNSSNQKSSRRPLFISSTSKLALISPKILLTL